MPAKDFLQRIESARNGTNPTVVCKVSSGWVVLCDQQYLRGYCILLADPVVESINSLDLQARSRFMLEMSVIGDVLLQITGAYRINYGLFSNTDPFLHAHIIPRYLNEPDEIRHYLPWSYSQEIQNATPFDPIRDQVLMNDLARMIQARLAV